MVSETAAEIERAEKVGRVLILVLVEDGLGVLYVNAGKAASLCGLNPCFSGGWSRSTKSAVIVDDECVRLNPCFSGGWSRS